MQEKLFMVLISLKLKKWKKSNKLLFGFDFLEIEEIEEIKEIEELDGETSVWGLRQEIFLTNIQTLLCI
jgi:hypothetical protein